MNVLIMTDLEGVAGVVSFVDQGYADGRYHEHAKRLLTEEVNAAVTGLMEEGTEEILVFDGHGPGGISYDDLHPEARLMHGRPLAPRDVLTEHFRQYDVSLIIGQHAMAGSDRGTLNHTQNSREVEFYELNGRPIGETAQWALYVGAFGIPVIFLSGDDVACREVQGLIPGITTAAVKIGLGRTSAISLSKAQSRRLIRDGARTAVRQHQREPVQPLVWDPPFELEKRYMTTSAADRALAYPLCERIDAQTVRIRSENILEVIYR